MSKLPVIYRFTNATVILWNSLRESSSILLLEDGEELKRADKLLPKDVAERLKWSTRIYGPSSGELQLVESKWSQELISYIPKDGKAGLRRLSEEDYGKLSAGFQKLYEKELAEPVETRTVLRFELQELELELREQFLLGTEFSSELQAQIQPIRDRKRRNSYGSYGKQEKQAELSRNLPVELSTDELMDLIELFGKKILNGNRYGAVANGRGGGYSGPRYFDISFLAEPYGGKQRKVLDKKQNGQPYKDQRGRMVPDRAPVVGSATVTQTDIAGWWKSVGGDQFSDEGKLEALEALTGRIWRL